MHITSAMKGKMVNVSVNLKTVIKAILTLPLYQKVWKLQ